METSVDDVDAGEKIPDLTTGLPSLSSLVDQIQALQEQVRLRVGPRRTFVPGYVLLIVNLASGIDRHSSLFLRARTASLLRSLFVDEPTIALVRPGMFAVLARERPDLAPQRAFLVSMLEEFEVDARVSTERIPVDGPATAQLFSTLLLSGEWHSVN